MRGRQRTKVDLLNFNRIFPGGGGVRNLVSIFYCSRLCVNLVSNEATQLNCTWTPGAPLLESFKFNITNYGRFSTNFAATITSAQILTENHNVQAKFPYCTAEFYGDDI